MNEILVSVVLPSYNHEKFIIDALQSVISQDYPNIELIIIDDASTDNSCIIIDDFIKQHPLRKIKYIRHEQNAGAVNTLNELFDLAEGDYVALINSDDVWDHSKIRQQVQVLSDFPEIGAVFTHASFINDKGKVLGASALPYSDFFVKENQPQGHWLRDFFFHYNSLCHSSMMIRKSIHKEIGEYDSRYKQLPDFDYWIRLLKKYEIFIVQQKLVFFRLHEGNVSKPNLNALRVNDYEISIIMGDFFSKFPDELFVNGFSDFFIIQDPEFQPNLECEKAFLFIHPRALNETIFNNLGLSRLYTLMKEPTIKSILKSKYDFSETNLHELVSKTPIFIGKFSIIANLLEKFFYFAKSVLIKFGFFSNIVYGARKRLRNKYE